MRRERILKIILVLMIGILLFARPVNIYAVSSTPLNINDYSDFEDQTNTVDTNTIDTNTTKTNTNTVNTQKTNTNTVNTNTINTNTANANKYNTNIPPAGLTGDTMMGITITLLIITSVYAYKKINEYKNM